VSKRRLGTLLRAGFWLCLSASGCSSANPSPRQGAQAEASPLKCAVDQVRESYCEGLLPMSTATGAPPPYESCPAGIEVPAAGAYPAHDRVARFDAPYTEVARRRAKPGHACCYSWCASLKVADPTEVLPYAGCNQPGAARESYCFPELESGTTSPGPGALSQCPLAIRPPETVSFSVPKAAPLDLASTQQRRRQGDKSCCYGWCSRMPVGI
jgi:hypothetical protein